jgi:hypothetical protein
MKRSVQGALMVVALMISVPVMQAQNRIRADVPFAFNMEQVRMAAGNYEIAALSDKVLVVRSLESGQGRLLLKPMQVQARQVQNPKLVFHKYGEQYFLSQVWNGSSNIGIQFSISQREKELRMARNGSPIWPETVIVAMK